MMPNEIKKTGDTIEWHPRMMKIGAWYSAENIKSKLKQICKDLDMKPLKAVTSKLFYFCFTELVVSFHYKLVYLS